MNAVKAPETWSSRSLGSRLQHGIFYRLIGLGGRKAAYALLFFVALGYMLKPEAVRRSAPYLRRRFPGAGFFGRLRRRWLLQWTFGKTLVDRAVAGISGNFEAGVSQEEIAVIHARHAEGKGLILLSAHVGPWQVAMSILPKYLPEPVSVVLHRDAGDIDRHYFEHTGEKPPFTLIDPALGPQSAIAMAQTLQGNGLLCMMGDRPFGGGHVCRVPFLGAEIAVPFTPYYLASHTGAPIVVFLSYRTGPGKVTTTIAGTIRVPPGLGKEAGAYAPFARCFTAMLEQSVAAAPYQFFNFYNMWET
ncbi:MAG: lysophospholipid acyltransferase family protein [Desulfovibrio sp.]|jgi:predicted LPLAT superfamily acyltransferase|nr:lysophospholipid acyltransferase family protein [Desulfovibrio sp.]